MAPIPKTTRQWILANHPKAHISLSGPDQTFSLQTNPIPELKPNQVLLHSLYFSNDPAQRPWITKFPDPSRLYTKPVEKGEVMRSYLLAEVIASTSDKVTKGTHVFVEGGWAEFGVYDAGIVRPLQDIPGLKETHYLGALGTTGMTAYYGIKEIGEVKPEDTVVVSGAAGATGSMVVQIAKHILGAKRVVGIAGTEEKCRWVESLGAEACVNYKDADFKDKLWKATPEGADVYFDNVGGSILDLLLTRLNTHGRIVACGVIDSYNSSEMKGVKNWSQIIFQRLQVRGFIVTDFFNAGGRPKATTELVKAFQDGKIKIGDEGETVVDTKFEDIPKVFTGLFEGTNQGKLVTKLVS